MIGRPGLAVNVSNRARSQRSGVRFGPLAEQIITHLPEQFPALKR
jgi:hypothetical protein